VVLAPTDLPQRFSVLPDEGWAGDDPEWDTRDAIARYIRGFASVKDGGPKDVAERVTTREDRELIISTAVLFPRADSCPRYAEQQRHGFDELTRTSSELDGIAMEFFHSAQSSMNSRGQQPRRHKRRGVVASATGARPSGPRHELEATAGIEPAMKVLQTSP